MFAASDTLAQRLGRPPTAAEISELVGIDEESVSLTLETNRHYRTDSWDEVSGSEDGRVDDARGCDEEALDRIDAEDTLGQLDDRLRKIVVWRFWEECTQSEIGARLGIGQVQVSRLLRRALEQLRSARGLEVAA